MKPVSGGLRPTFRALFWAWFCSWFCSFAAVARAGNLAPSSGTYGATFGAGAATAAERSGFGQNPAALRPHTAEARFDFHRPFGLPDLSVAEAGIAWDGARAGIAADWRATCIEGLYSEHGLRFAPAARLAAEKGFPGRVDAGYAAAFWRRAAAGGPRPDWVAEQGAGIDWMPFPRLAAGAFVAGIPFPGGGRASERVIQFGFAADTRALEGWGGGGSPPEIGATGAAGRSAPVRAAGAATGSGLGQSLRLDFRKTGGSPWRALASLSFRPWAGAEITAGAATPPFQIGAGICLAWRQFRVRRSLRYHRYLGNTWLSGAALTLPAGGRAP